MELLPSKPLRLTPRYTLDEFHHPIISTRERRKLLKALKKVKKKLLLPQRKELPRSLSLKPRRLQPRRRLTVMKIPPKMMVLPRILRPRSPRLPMSKRSKLPLSSLL